MKNQHTNHKLTLGQRTSDKISEVVGSWKFIVIQTIIFAIWISLNIIAWENNWDPYPFVFLNLIVGIQASYTAPIIMMSQNRAAERDRKKMELDYCTNRKAEKEIEQIQAQIAKMEKNKIDKILEIINK